MSVISETRAPLSYIKVNISASRYYDNNVQSLSYDAYDHRTQYIYDGNNKLLSTIDPENHTVSQTYDADGNIHTRTDGRGNITTYEYDHENRLTSVTNPKQEVTSYTYDANGNLLTQTDGKQHVTTYEYNIDNKVTKKIDNNGRAGTAPSYYYNQLKNRKLSVQCRRNRKNKNRQQRKHHQLPV